MVQFICAGVGFTFPGKKLMIKTSTRKMRLAPLRSRPKVRPRLNLDGRSCILRQRLSMMQLMDTMYEERMATRESEVMLASAMVEPMLIRDSRQENIKETMIEFNGTSQPGRT